MLKIRQFTFNPIQENTYVITNEKDEAIIIDPGCYFENERKELTDFIDTHKLLPKCLLNTHCHLDHVFGNKMVADTYALSVHLHPLERQVYDNSPAVGERWGLPFQNPSGEPLYVHEGIDIAFGDHRFQGIIYSRSFSRQR